MLALLGFLGLAMSSFVMLGREESLEDDSAPDPDQTLETGTMAESSDMIRMLSDTDSDAVADAVLGGEADETAVGIDVDPFEALYAADSGSGVTPDTVDIPEPPVIVTPPPDDEDADHGDELMGDDADDPIADDSEDVIADDADGPIADDSEDVIADLRLTGTEADDALSGGIGNDAVAGGDGDDDLYGNLGDDRLWGDGGDDRLTGGDGADALYGGDGDDVLAGGWGDDMLQGENGDDLLNGGAGNDILDGRDDDDGFDFLNGGAGDDLLMAGRGDHLNGGDGSDIFAVLSDGGNAIDDFDPEHDVLEVAYAGEVPPVLSTLTTEGGITLMADDAVVAHLAGLKSLDLASVVLIAA